MNKRVILLIMVMFSLQAVILSAGDSVEFLIEACRTGDIETVRYELAAGTDPNARNSSGTAPLIEAVSNRYYPTVKLLLAAGADPNTRTGRKTPVIVLAARQGDIDVIEALIQAGADVDASDTDNIEYLTSENGINALWAAARWGMIETVFILLEAGADPSSMDVDGVPAWAVAEAYGHYEISRKLIEAGVEMDQPGDIDDDPL